MNSLRKIAILIVLVAFLALTVFCRNAISQPYHDFKDIDVTVYLNEECSCCVEYTEELVRFLNELGITKVDIKYLVSNKEFSLELKNLYRELKIPKEYRTGYLVKIGENMFIEGHPPLKVLEEILLRGKEYGETIIVSQKEMHFWKNAKKYNLILSDGRILTCNADTLECTDTSQLVETEELPLLLIVVSSGFLDGINPCAISLLVFFAAAAFTAAFKVVGKEKIKHISAKIFKKGGVFIAGVLIAYYSIGLGIIQAVRFIPIPHFAAKFFSVAVVFLSAMELLSVFSPSIGRVTRSYKPVFLADLITKIGEETTLPLIFLIGFLTGLCTLPCSGSIYLAILSLLAVKTSFLEGLFYLTIYNLAYISPLVVILALSSNRRTLGRISRMRNRRVAKVVGNVLILAIGVLLVYISFSL